MQFNENTKILIVGLGLMGGSYADALSSQGYTVGAIDTNAESIKYALEHKIIASGKSENDGEYISGFDLIIFAVYPHVILNWIEENQKYIKKGTLLTDVTGVKSCFIYDLQKILSDDLEFIGAHPMAGRESSGVQNATKDIFKNANYIITPTEKNSQQAIETCRQLGSVIGSKTISELTPEAHDEMIGFLSQLTHCIAVSLMTCRDSESFTKYTGDSFRDLTRIAKINDEMWSELFLLNQKELLTQMDHFGKQFKKLYKLIKRRNKEEIRKIMKESTSRRIKFDKR
ncbi:MAG: prephenate dehydrogenase [Treponema sp.]|nr:prephenate dehydrogenase [Treponema sp.]